MRHSALRAWAVLLALSCCGEPAQAAGLIPQSVAARHGMKRAWYAQVGSPWATGEIAHVNLDHGLLLVQSSRGKIHAINAESGRMLWSNQPGPVDHMCTEPAASEKFVAVVNGSVLYVLDRADGKLLWEKRLSGAPAAGPGVTTTHAFVPLVNGAIEGYDLAKGAQQSPWVYRGAGRVSMPPMATPQTVSWTTEKGHYYVAGPEAQGIRFRLEARVPIATRPAYWTPYLFACSTDGVVYAINEQNGKIDWRYAMGDESHVSPVAIEDKVFVASEYSGMHCLDAATGKSRWFVPNIKQFVAASPRRVYVCDTVGRMAVLDSASGTRLSTLSLPGISIKMLNSDNDRIYLADHDCVVQCFHEAQLTKPVAYVPPPPKLKSKLPGPGKKKAEDTETPEDSQPEETGEMPAGEPAAGDEENPFATDEGQ